ncbi:MAG: hypothetical protein ACLRYY_10425 [Anaerobutyricum soehngenii]
MLGGSGSRTLIMLGVAVAFSYRNIPDFVTLPVEFNASSESIEDFW